jgi:hypothetical protein
MDTEGEVVNPVIATERAILGPVAIVVQSEDVDFYRAVNSGNVNVWGMDLMFSETSLSGGCPELRGAISSVLLAV